jgi:hypothetical protein
MDSYTMRHFPLLFWDGTLYSFRVDHIKWEVRVSREEGRGGEGRGGEGRGEEGRGGERVPPATPTGEKASLPIEASWRAGLQ